jgi:hypothetical protein
MIAYQITINGKIVATAGLQQGVVSAIANWVYIPSDDATDPKTDWHAGFSLGALDNITKAHLKWILCDVGVGDEISIKLIETDTVDEPTERKPRKETTQNDDSQT